MPASDLGGPAVAVAVLGFVAFDHPMAVAALPGSGSAALIDRRLAAPWPRLGGAGANVARAVAALLGEAGLVSRVGTDDAGNRARSELKCAGVRLDGLAVDADRTAASWLFYDIEGNSVAFMDPGGRSRQQLIEPQRQVLRSAQWICIAAGSPEMATATLNAVDGQARILWIVTADALCFPPPLVARLAIRADVVVLNAAEATFIGPLRKLRGSVVITDGTNPIRYSHGGRWAEERVDAAEVDDLTGAGDAFAGALAATLSAVPRRDFGEAIATAKDWTRSFLIARSTGAS